MKFMHTVQPTFSVTDLATPSVPENPPASIAHRCPLCRRAVNEGAEICDHCGAALAEDEENQSKSMWLLIIVGLIGAMTFSFSVIR